MSDTVLKKEERISLELRSLYQKYGYLPYKMSKFEQYDLYVENKEFLVGDGVITFTDTDGRLMALKPDVTLSIIKNDLDDKGKRKVYYDENVYRISAKTKQFKEIQQAGLECVGEITLYDVYETVCLAAESLAKISPDFQLDISHLGVVAAVLAKTGGSEEFRRAVTRTVGDKNPHETAALCERYGVDEEAKAALLALIAAYGDMQTVLDTIAPLCKGTAAFESLQALCALLQKSPYASKIRLDFSVVNDMNYYDDVVFKGFIQGVGEGVLSGGRYDKLLSRMGRKSGAIGFAVYLDLLEGFGERKSEVDVDTLLLVDGDTDQTRIIEKVQELVAAGKSVRVQAKQGELRYGEIIRLTEGKE